MDGSAAIEWNCQALKRIVAMLVEMAGMAEDADSPIPTRRPDDRPSPEGRTIADDSADPHSGLLRKPPLPLKGGEEGGASSPPLSPLPRRSGERWPAKRVGEGIDFTRDDPCQKGAPERQGKTLPRLLWRAIMALLRPAESAARRLIIAAAAGLNVPPPRPCKPQHGPERIEQLLRKFGIAVMVSRGGGDAILPRSRGVSGRFAGGRSIVPVARWKASERRDGASAPETRPAGTMRSMVEGALPEGGGVEPRIPTFPLFDPPRRLALYGQRRYTVPPHAAPRIFVPGITEPAPLPPPPSPEDFVSAMRLTRRLAALTAALDDLPGQARRFARWKASRDAISAQGKESDTAAAQNESGNPATPRRISPLRRGRPPGGRLSRYDPGKIHPRNIREVDEILAHAHSLALCALESPDTS